MKNIVFFACVCARTTAYKNAYGSTKNNFSLFFTSQFGQIVIIINQ